MKTDFVNEEVLSALSSEVSRNPKPLLIEWDPSTLAAFPPWGEPPRVHFPCAARARSSCLLGIFLILLTVARVVPTSPS